MAYLSSATSKMDDLSSKEANIKSKKFHNIKYEFPGMTR